MNRHDRMKAMAVFPINRHQKDLKAYSRGGKSENLGHYEQQRLNSKEW